MDRGVSIWDRGLYIGPYPFGIGVYDRYLSQRDRYLYIGPYPKWIGGYHRSMIGTYPKRIDRYLSKTDR